MLNIAVGNVDAHIHTHMCTQLHAELTSTYIHICVCTFTDVYNAYEVTSYICLRLYGASECTESMTDGGIERFVPFNCLHCIRESVTG